jgi:hypothetical protein
LSKCYIISEWRLWKVDATGDDIQLNDTTDEHLSLCQMPGSTFIKNLIITINGREVFNANQLYAYKAYLDIEFSYPKTVKDSFLSCVGYASDGGDQDSTTGGGFKARNKIFNRSKVVQFITNIDADLFAQDLYLINNCEVDIEISPHGNDFMLIQPSTNTNNYRLELFNIKLYVKTIELMDGLSLDLARRLDAKPARYSMRKSMLKSLFISEGRYEFNSNIFTDEVPRRIMIGFLETNAFHGNKNKSPFNFKNFNVRDIAIVANGRDYPQTV